MFRIILNMRKDYSLTEVNLFWKLLGRSGSYRWEDHRPPSGVYKGTNGGEVISFSGCDDDQTAADTQVKTLLTLLHFFPLFISHFNSSKRY